MAFLLPLVFFAMCSTNVLGGRVVIRDCPAGATGVPTGANRLTFDSVEVTGCDKEPCVFITGENHVIEINATANFATKKLLYSMVGVMQSPPTTIPIFTDQNFCEFLVSGSSCDTIAPGTKISAKRNQKVEGVPVFSGTMRTIIKDENMASVYCGEFNILVKTKIPSVTLPSSFPGFPGK